MKETGLITCVTAKEFQSTRMAVSTRASGSKMPSVAWELRYGRTRILEALTRTARKMGSESINGKMMPNTKATGWKAR